MERGKKYIYSVYYRYSPIFPLFKTIQIEGFIHKNNARKAAGYRASPLSLLQFRKAGRAAEARGYFRTAVRFCHPHPQPLFEGSAQTALLCGSPPPSLNAAVQSAPTREQTTAFCLRERAQSMKKIYTYTLKIATAFFFFLPGVIFVKRHLGCRSARNPRGALTPPAAPVPEPPVGTSPLPSADGTAGLRQRSHTCSYPAALRYLQQTRNPPSSEGVVLNPFCRSKKKKKMRK